MKKLLAVLAIGGMLMAIPSQSEAQVSAKLGLSSMTGLAGVEYQMGNISVGAGFLAGPIPLSVRYSLATEGNGLWVGLAYVLNKAEVWDDENFVDAKLIDAPLAGALVGYNMELNETLDLSLGGGYGVLVGAADVDGQDTGEPMLDISLGYSF
tara:strand:- start:1029 stop:1487 length:459 start_codon:yes stop_codon:yes gene_type:complete